MAVDELPKGTGGRWLPLGLFALFAFLIFPGHEFAHYVTYRALGTPLQMTLNTASPEDGSQRRAIAELAGPFFNLGLAAVGTALYFSGQRRRRWVAELILAAVLMRLVIYALILGAAIVTGSGLSLGNDEPIAAQLAGVPSLTSWPPSRDRSCGSVSPS